MGNTASCSCCSVGIRGGSFNKGNSTKTAMLLDTAGNTREIKLPVKSAELMIEEIGHVITPADELRRTRRISALRADQELLAGKLYLLVPANRVHSMASEFEMAIVARWGSEKKSGERRNKGKPSGNVAKVSLSPKLMEREGENNIELSSFLGNGKLAGLRFGNQGRWNPLLEPILESP